MIRLIRDDLPFDPDHEHDLEGALVEVAKTDLPSPITRGVITSRFQLPEDAVIKLCFQDRLIPWSMVGLKSVHTVDIRICRPHQNVKPQISEGQACSDDIVRKKVKELEGRIADLEAVADPALISAKTERDLQLLTKQIAFLARRLDEADKAEWIKKV